MRLVVLFAAALLTIGTSAHAASIFLDSDPFEGTGAAQDPARNIVGGPGTERTFNAGTDVIAFDRAVFGIDEVLFQNSLTVALPASGVNTIVVQDTGAGFGAGTAQALIAGNVTTPGPGFFIYFNTNPNLNVARLVYSTDLSNPQADLAILARLTTFSGPAGFAALPAIQAQNFAPIPEPSSLLLISGGVLLGGRRALRRRSARR